MTQLVALHSGGVDKQTMSLVREYQSQDTYLVDNSFLVPASFLEIQEWRRPGGVRVADSDHYAEVD